MENNSLYVDINSVTPDPHQPRKSFSDVESLAENIKNVGQIHPIEIDESGIIVVGERRYRAIKSLGWDKIKAIVNHKQLTPYDRLKRQMSENLHQSAARNGASMNPIDTARGWVRLYELKTGKNYNTAYSFGGKGTGRGIKGPFLEIAEEISADKETVFELLKLLDEPELIQDAIHVGQIPRTYIREANSAPEEMRDKIKDKILVGDYQSRDEIETEAQIARKLPDLATLEIERKRSKESKSTNRILNQIAKLALALEDHPLTNINLQERKIVEAQLQWLLTEIQGYLLDK